MKKEIIVTDKVKLVMTKDEYSYLEVLETFQHSKFIRIVTYNISKESNELINILDKLPEFKDVIIITNIPNRFKRYTSKRAKENAKITIDKYIDRLDPSKFNADLKAYFNFDNHSKIIMSDKIAYIGSANSSDESKYNNECGVIITDTNVIEEINKVFIEMQINESVSYYTNTYTKVFVMLSNLINKATIFSDEFYYSFFTEFDHGDGVVVRYDADLSSNLIEEINLLCDEIKETIAYFIDNAYFPDIFLSISLDIIDDIEEWFSEESDIEIFSRHDVQYKTEELFEEYYTDGDPEKLDEYAQIAFDNACDINHEYTLDIYDTATYCNKLLDQLNLFLLNLLKSLEVKKEINPTIDNT